MTTGSEIPEAAPTQAPQFQVVEKLRAIPVVGYACSTSTGVYNRFKGVNPLINWALQSAECVVGTAVETVGTPLANKFQDPINNVDAKLCYGLDMLQDKVPMVNDQPSEIYGKGKSYVNYTINTAIKESVKLRDMGWNKSNELLKTRYGNMAMSGLDSTSIIADKMIDYCLPPEEGEEVIHPHPNVECEDKVLHTAHTVGTLTNKMGHRVYRTVSRRFNNPPPQPMQQQITRG